MASSKKSEDRTDFPNRTEVDDEAPSVPGTAWETEGWEREDWERWFACCDERDAFFARLFKGEGVVNDSDFARLLAELEPTERDGYSYAQEAALLLGLLAERDRLDPPSKMTAIQTLLPIAERAGKRRFDDYPYDHLRSRAVAALGKMGCEGWAALPVLLRIVDENLPPEEFQLIFWGTGEGLPDLYGIRRAAEKAIANLVTSDGEIVAAFENSARESETRLRRKAGNRKRVHRPGTEK